MARLIKRIAVNLPLATCKVFQIPGFHPFSVMDGESLGDGTGHLTVFTDDGYPVSDGKYYALWPMETALPDDYAGVNILTELDLVYDSEGARLWFVEVSPYTPEWLADNLYEWPTPPEDPEEEPPIEP